MGVNHWIIDGDESFTEINQNKNTIKCSKAVRLWAYKVHGREGKSPDHRIRSLNITKCERKWRNIYNWNVVLEVDII